MRSSSLLLAALLSLAALPESALAQASLLRAQGRDALREGRFQDALALFRRAAAEAADPAVWLEVGDAADRLRDDAAALQAYEHYLAARPDAPDRVEVLARITVLRGVLARRGELPARTDRPAQAGFIPAATILDALASAPAPAPPPPEPLSRARQLGRP